MAAQSYQSIALSTGRSGPGTVIQGVPVLIDVSQAEFVFVPPSGFGVGRGYGTWHRPVPAAPSLAGLSLFAQWFALDAGSPSGVATSRGATIGIL